MTDNSFSIDVATIRDRARQKMGRGPVTEYYGTDPGQVVEILAEGEEHADDILDVLGSNVGKS